MDFSKWEYIEPYFTKLLDRKLEGPQDVAEWLIDSSELGAVISEEGARRYIAMTCATDDEAVEKAYLHFVDEIKPKIKPLANEGNRKLLDCPHTDELDPDRYGVLLRETRTEVELYRDENVPLMTEVERLSQQYQKIMGGLTVNFQGRELTLQQMGVFLEENNRELRQEAWEAVSERRLQEAEQLEEMFDKMLALRRQIASNAGFDDFRSYQFLRFNRFDYTPEDCIRFHDTVENIVVPVTRESLGERREAMGIDSVRPWDTSCDKYGRPPLKPFDNTDKLAYGCRGIFGRVDKELGDRFQTMIDLGLLDLSSRKGKAPGGYQSSLAELRLPFIFMNAVGLNRDLFTLLHEGGHAFHQFAVRSEPLLTYRHAPMEFSEVASMAMEHLGASHLNAMYENGDAARAELNHLESDLAILPWIAIVDAFQHWIYTHPHHTPSGRAEEWTKLMSRFDPGVDYSGYERALTYRWHAQLHIFEYPFYYIEYGIALLGALQVWRNSHQDLQGATDAYKTALALGGSKPLPELFNAAAIQFDFSQRTIAPLMGEVQTRMHELASLERR